MTYEHHKNLLDQELENYVNRKIELEQSLKDLKESHREKVVSIITCCHNNPKVIDDLASHVYIFNRNIDANTLGGLLSIDNNKGSYSMVKHIKTFGLESQCVLCGERITFCINSRSNDMSYDKHGRVSGGSWQHKKCDKCEKARQEKYDKQQEEYAETVNTHRAERIALKTMPYDKYLKTDHWQDTRKKALKRADYQCEVCNSNGQLHVHHKTYVRRGNEWNADLIVLCANCHAKFHDKLETETSIS